MRSPFRVLVVLAAGVLAACPPPPPATEDGGSDAGCSGQVGCECAEGASCSTGECVGGTCVDCRRGEAACVCRANGTCNTGLRCVGATCQACPAGELACACNAGDTCGNGLVCSNGTCVQDTCTAGTQSCPCRASDPKCDGTAYCDGTSRCQACSSDVVGCPCDSSSMCQGGTVCDTATTRCRAALTCADLVTSGACLMNQACVETPGVDATCTPMMCVPGFVWNGSACQACVSTDCASEPTCAPGDAGIGDTCAAQHRECTTSGQVAACGNCLQGYTANTSGACVPVPSCGSTTCGVTEYCDRTGTPTCLPLPCPAGQARGSTGVCATCTISCTGQGFSGRVWPFRSTTDVCYCETLDGYFHDPAGASRAILCDADDDGWVREEADDAVVNAQPAIRANSRCSIRTASRVRLVDEYRVSVEVLSCAEGLLKASRPLADGGYPNGGLPLASDGGLLPLADGGTACSALLPMRLLETERNDVPNSPASASFPSYGAALADGGVSGRALAAAELNSLTKACVSTAADFNHDGTEDIREVQGRVNGPDDRARLESFAYFMELEEAWWESAGTGRDGTLVIQERSRCETAFPLRYDPLFAAEADGGTSDGYAYATSMTPTPAQPYWRNCARDRDPDYNQATAAPGFDFAAWSCDQASGACGNLKPAHATLVGPTDPNTTLFRNFGLCELRGARPADGLWRGLHHHSQFKCVNIVTSTAAPYDRLATDFGSAQVDKLTFNECAARSCATPGDASCSATLGSGAQSRQAVIECRPQGTGTVGRVGFAAVNYQTPSPGYAGGCVDEDANWKTFICPFPEFSPTVGDPANFGRYSCFGRGSNFLWGGSGAPRRATLRWGSNSNGSVLR